MLMEKRHRGAKGQRHRGTKALCLCAFAPMNLCLWVGIVSLLLCLAAGPCWSFSGLRVAVEAAPCGRPHVGQPLKERGKGEKLFSSVPLCLCASVPVARTSEAINPQHATGNTSLNPQPATSNDSFSVPLLYELYWFGCISMVVLLIFYFLYLYKKEKFRLVKPLTFLLLFLALSLYLMEQGQIFTGHFDPVRHLFVAGYHEANEIGFLRFIYKLTLGIALCVYGFTNFLARQKVEAALSSLNKGPGKEGMPSRISQNKKSMNSEAEPK